MAVKLPEFIQVEGITEVQKEIQILNDELNEAMSQTGHIRELIAEKNELMHSATDISSMLIPEVRKLNAFMGGGSFDEEPLMASPRRRGRPRMAPGVEIIPKPRAAKRKPRRPKAVAARRPRRPRKAAIPKALAMSLPKELRPKPVKAKRGRGRPRKAKPVTEVAERQNPLEELRRNLARLRDE